MNHRCREAVFVYFLMAQLFVLGCNSSSTNSTTAGSGVAASKEITDTSALEAPGPQTEPPLVSSPPEPEKAAGQITVQIADRAGLDAVLAKHKGRVVLVDYWATWCAPCRKKFPHTVALAKELQPEGLSVIAVAMDDEDAREDVERFLNDQNATFDNLLAKGGASDELFESFEIPDGSLPCLRLFDRDGKPVKTFAIDQNADQQFTDDDVAAAVRELLKAGQ